MRWMRPHRTLWSCGLGYDTCAARATVSVWAINSHALIRTANSKPDTEFRSRSATVPPMAS